MEKSMQDPKEEHVDQTSIKRENTDQNKAQISGKVLDQKQAKSDSDDFAKNTMLFAWLLILLLTSGGILFLIVVYR